VDLFCEATRKHFADLFQRYGNPIICLNLLKTKEHAPRESTIATEYENTINYLNDSLPASYKIKYISFDMKNVGKESMDLCLSQLYKIADDSISTTNLFSVTPSMYGNMSVTHQFGVLRINCIDCIDRTNAAMLLAAHQALEAQLKRMKLIESISKQSPIFKILSLMYEEMGDELALQYSGSQAHKAIPRYSSGKTVEWVVSIKRHWANIITDAARQKSINLFLGVYKPSNNIDPLWEIQDDTRLHNPLIHTNRPPRKKWWSFEVSKFKKRIGYQRQKKFESIVPSATSFKERSMKRNFTVIIRSNTDEVTNTPSYKQTKIEYPQILLLNEESISHSLTILSRKLANPIFDLIELRLEPSHMYANKARNTERHKNKSTSVAEFKLSSEEVKYYHDYVQLKHLSDIEIAQELVADTEERIPFDTREYLDQAETLEEISSCFDYKIDGKEMLKPIEFKELGIIDY
jgi:hypothetical protein